MNTELPSTKPPFFPPEGFPIRLRPDVMVSSSLYAAYRQEVSVWVGPHEEILGSSEMAGPEGERAAYYDVINQLINLAYFHYTNYLDSINYTMEEEKGTSFDDSPE